jgi:DNA-binding transcriptional MerR regulator
LYRIHEFADMAGVTVKALRHYDRLGLLRPRRTEAGYRIYVDRDLERLEQIVALKFVGVPLKQIKILLERDPLQLPAALRLQRSVLEEKRRSLDRAITALGNAEKALESGAAASAAVLKRIIEVMAMQTSTEFMKNYYREEAWALFEERHPVWPSQAWIDLFRDVEAALGEDPAGEKAQALARRWRELRVRDAAGDPRIHWGLIKAWRDRQYWPEEVQKHLSESHFGEISKFIGRAFAAYRKQHYGEIPTPRQLEGFTPAERERLPLASAGLYFSAVESLDEDPGSEKAQALAARWMELMETSAGAERYPQGDYEKLIQWMQNWPADFRREIHAIDYEKISGFLLRALGVAFPAVS